MAATLVAGHGTITTEFFDVGVSRRVAWERRPQAAALLERTARINEWIGSLFAPQNRDATVRALVASQGDPAATARGDAARQRLAEAEATLRRFQEAIAAGVDPVAIVEPINRARAERDTARACLAHPEQQPELHTEAQVKDMAEGLGDVGAVIGHARPDRLADLYREPDIGVRYEPSEFGGSATVTMRVASECVRTTSMRCPGRLLRNGPY